MTLALTGATGFVGQAVLDEAARRGLNVRALTRREQEPREGVTWVRGDLHNGAALSELVEGADVVLHIAGVVNAPDLPGFLSGNVEGTQNVVNATRAAELSRVVCVSSLAAREPGLSDYGQSKRLAEEIVQTSGLDWCMVRPPAIYGPRDPEIFELFKAAKMGVVPMPPAGRASIIHVDDLARLLLDLDPAQSSVRHHIFEPDDGADKGWSHEELAQAIGNAMGKRVWSPAMPAWLIKLGGRLDRLLRGRKAKLTPDRARYMIHPDWVSDAARNVPSYIWSPAINTSEGLAETAKWYAENHWI